MGYSGLDIVLYILIIGIPLLAQAGISISYNKYKNISNTNGLTGFDVARKILDENGLNDIYIVEVAGDLTDHYDPTRKTIRLSKNIFHGNTIASSAVAAHECGHAIQDKVGYVPMRIRSMLVPVTNLATNFAWIVIAIGVIAQHFNIIMIGIALISIGLLFHLFTLPVELDASRRAKQEIERLGLVNNDEKKGASKMLGAAAMTYVAAVLTSFLQIIRLLEIFGNDRR